MRLLDKIKYAIPLTFAILFIIILLGLGVLSILGIYPFKVKSIENGVIFILVGFFFGFYPGMVFGHLILYLLNQCCSDKQENISFSV